MEKLNRKLAEWVGFELKKVQCVGLIYYEQEQECWYYKGREYGFNIPLFTKSLDACDKWLMPKLTSFSLVMMGHNDPELVGHYVSIRVHKTIYSAEAKSFALALCQAIEKLVDGSKQ